MDGWNQKVTQKQQEYDDAVTEKQNLTQQLGELSRKLEELSQQAETLRTQIQEARKQDSDAEQEMENVQRQLRILHQKNEETEKKLAVLEEEKTQKQNICTELADALEQIKTKTQALQTQIEEKENQVTEMDADKDKHQNSLKYLEKQIKNYQELFSSENYQQEINQIKSYKQCTEIYENALKQLFGADACLSQAQQQEMKQKRELLKKQLSQVQENLSALKTEYLTVVEDTERKVSRHAM